MLDRGKLVVLAMFGLALVAAGLAWSFNYHRGRRTLEFYGRDPAFALRTAPRVELLRLAPAGSAAASDPAAEVVMVGTQRHSVIGRADISQAKGLIHARTSLLADSSYLWDSDHADCRPQFEFAVRFSGQTTATLALDFGCGRVWYVESGKSVTLIPKVSAGWKSFLDRHVRADAAGKR